MRRFLWSLTLISACAAIGCAGRPEPEAPEPEAAPVPPEVPAEIALPPAESAKDREVRTLLGLLNTTEGAELAKAARALHEEFHLRGIGTLPRKETVDALINSLDRKSTDVRYDILGALIAIGDESELPLYIRFLDDPDPVFVTWGYGGLDRLGPKAIGAAPHLIAKIAAGKVFRFATLAKIVGKNAVPVILDAVARYEVGDHATWEAVRVLYEYPDPSASEYMGKMLASPQHTAMAGLYFAAIADEPALARFRKCLTSPAPDPADATQHVYGGSEAAVVRSLAVKTLGAKKDKASFEAILKMLSDDPSILVRAAAAVAMGEYADPKAIPALVKSFDYPDANYSSQGHTKGTLRRAAVRSIAKIGTADALVALYAGSKGGPAQNPCIEFWCGTKDPKHFAAYLKLFDAEPIPPKVGAGLIESLLRNQPARKELTVEERTAAEKEFAAQVDDDKRFGPKSDLTDGGKWTIRYTYSFLSPDFVSVDFTMRSTHPNGRGFGDSVLYRKTAGRWKPMGITGVETS